MYESPLFLAAHDEDGGGRSVPTTPLQLAAPGNALYLHTAISVYGLYCILTCFSTGSASDCVYRVSAFRQC